jgi:Do/DeqQ family serine protease
LKVCGAAAILALLLGGAVELPSAPPSNLANRRSPVVAAVEKTRAAVVAVTAEELVRIRVPGRPVNDPVAQLFGDFLEQPRYRKGYAVTSLGSGVIVSPDGWVLTNNHVVERGARFRVQLVDGRELPAKVAGTDPSTDLAILKVETPEKLPFVPIGRTDDLLIGETVIAIGNPFGLSHTVTTGVVSAVHRNFKGQDRTFFDFVQTDASINPGNSGGALVNVEGALVGVNTAILGDRSSGIGFAIPAERCRRIAEELVAHGEVREGFLGIEVADVAGRDEPGPAEGARKARGVIVTGVDPGSPAATAGLKSADVVEKFDGEPVQSAEEYRFRARNVTIGKTATLEVLRGEARLSVPVKAAELGPDKIDAVVSRRVGLELSEKVEQRRGLRFLVVQAVKRGSAAERAGIAPGDLVREVNSHEVSSIAEYRKVAARARRSGALVLLIQRGYAAERIAFELD